jgi:hypothetical protein
MFCYQQVCQVFSVNESIVSAEEKLQNSEADPNCLIIANISFLAFSKYEGEILDHDESCYLMHPVVLIDRQ